MSPRVYGIYIAYPPLVDLRHQGLGRYIAALLGGARDCGDVRFTVVCPSWSREALQALLTSEGIAPDTVDIVAPQGQPYLLLAYNAYRAYRARPAREGLRRRLLRRAALFGSALRSRVERRFAAANDIPSAIVMLLEALPLLLLGFALLPLLLIYLLARRARGLLGRPLPKIAAVAAGLRGRLSRVLFKPQDEGWILRLFNAMNEAETRRMQEIIERLDSVKAWYSPTPFWPAFNHIAAPRLMCVPDVVFADFAAGFAGLGGERFLQTFTDIGATIKAADWIVTYSETVKWQTLVQRYEVPAGRIAVIRHAPNRLDRWVTIKDFANPDDTAQSYCQNLLREALLKSDNIRYASLLRNRGLKFLFYASQLRPNKNVLTLLRAYEYLLRHRYIGHKLILTGDPAGMPDIERFVADQRLQDDVLFLHGLSVPQLAACYKLAELAVNPSLSEGGCPFTFSEALSVGTPVVMARIAVTEEVLREPELQAMTFFDPYDWKDVAARIEWALAHREQLLAAQRTVYAGLQQRSWADVAGEHIDLLDRITAAAQPRELAT